MPLALVAVIVFAIVVLIGFAFTRLRQRWEHLAPNAFVADIYRQLLRISSSSLVS
ncbi:MAG: hypothetical protein ACJAVT_002559 [Yoonia sp.]